jgi:hypothetical protein
MRRTLIVYCEACGSDRPSGDDFVIFHCLAFCSADCRGAYQAADDERREQKTRPARGKAA